MPIADPPSSVVTRVVHILAAAGVTVLPIPTPRGARLIGGPGRREKLDCESGRPTVMVTDRQDRDPKSSLHADYA